MARHYYYLLSSLPELLFQNNSNTFDFDHYKTYISGHLDQSDLNLVNYHLYSIDNQNIIGFLYPSAKKWLTGGLYTHESLQVAINERTNLPKYLSFFFQDCGLQSDDSNHFSEIKLSQIQAEHQLYSRFYDEVEKSKNKFTSQWYTFDREVRNIQAAYASQHLDCILEEHLIGQDDLTEILIKNKKKGLGLARERDYLPELLTILEIENLLERERKLDLFRWRQVDEMVTFDYFSIEAILAFLQKALILDRWLKLDPISGKQQFRKLVEELKGSYQL